MTYYVASIPYSPNDIYHHGIKGQKWGVRRYQNSDGTLTAEGKAKYRDTEKTNKLNQNRNEKIKKAAKIGLAIAGTAAAGYGLYRLGKNGTLSDLASKAGSSLADSRSRRKEIKARIKNAVNVHRFDDKDLAAKIGRLEAEAKYQRLVADSLKYSPTGSKEMFIDAGKKIMGGFLAGFGAYGIKSLMTHNFNAKEAAGYVAPNPNKKK